MHPSLSIKRTISTTVTLAVLFTLTANDSLARWTVDSEGNLIKETGRPDFAGSPDDQTAASPPLADDSEAESDNAIDDEETITTTPTPKPRPPVSQGRKNLKLEVDEDNVVVTSLEESTIATVGEEEGETDQVNIEDSEDKNVTKIRSTGNAAAVIRNRIAAQTHFPIMVNTDTNELIITTPAGSKVVAVLPDQAVQNMLAANVLDEIGGKGGIRWTENQPTPSPSPDTSPAPSTSPTTSPTPEISPTTSPNPSPETSPLISPSPSTEPIIQETDATIELVTTEDGTLAYRIEGTKRERLLGVYQVVLRRTAIVSAETGALLRIEQSLPTRLLAIFSF